ncbi:MAG: hypothetical protein KatS3mg012_1292 [Gaiellaceae bacterium]|jgi:hypothetical protein|nr:MAG: hypothetical protein KatS3mg012_1292 [Gaiellaceae bacterium]
MRRVRPRSGIGEVVALAERLAGALPQTVDAVRAAV